MLYNGEWKKNGEQKMIMSKKYWDELIEKSKNENLDPLEVVPLHEQEQ